MMAHSWLSVRAVGAPIRVEMVLIAGKGGGEEKIGSGSDDYLVRRQEDGALEGNPSSKRCYVEGEWVP